MRNFDRRWFCVVPIFQTFFFFPSLIVRLSSPIVDGFDEYIIFYQSIEWLQSEKKKHRKLRKTRLTVHFWPHPPLIIIYYVLLSANSVQSIILSMHAYD